MFVLILTHKLIHEVIARLVRCSRKRGAFIYDVSIGVQDEYAMESAFNELQFDLCTGALRKGPQALGHSQSHLTFHDTTTPQRAILISLHEPM
jgi:hypothetical protein